MSNLQKVAISIGDLNGIGIQLALENHHIIKQEIEPIYCIDREMLEQASSILNIPIPDDFETLENIGEYFEIEAGVVSSLSGAYSYSSFIRAVELAKDGKIDAITTLPINKKAWEMAGIEYKGHTDTLRDFFGEDAIMMLGTPNMFVALFTEHIPLQDVSKSINEMKLTKFLLNFYKNINPTKLVGVLGLNPHAGDDGVLGDEEQIIQKAIDNANETLGVEIFSSPLVPDIAFTPSMRKKFTHFVAMYHDQGLAPLKALFFDESINVSLNLPILRTSVDHGTAFDKAYKNADLSSLSYLNSIQYIINKGKIWKTV
ncbi:MAG: 4-hydroxythreonine-4-phosphate dehydrogenase [Sulfurovum sp.]